MTDMYSPDCPECKGTGDRDSGGTHPWGAAAYIRCDCDRFFPPINIMKLHPTNVLGLQPTEELGKALMSLRYDLLAPVLEGMVKEARRQAKSDEKKDRVKLAFRLNELADGLENAHTALGNVLSVVDTYIKAEIEACTVSFKGPVYMESVNDQIQFSYEGRDILLKATRVGFVIGARIDENGVATLVYQ